MSKEEMFVICWAGDFVYMCKKHTAQLKTVANAIGSPFNYRPYKGDEKCRNCERENKQ